jgi:riboflavin kinase/FMN adenylyltransferase
MLIRRGFEPGPDADRGCVVAIGNFDGLHLGHQAILAVLQQRGREAALPAVVLTFEPHPREYFHPAEAPARLMRLRDKAEWLAGTGIAELRVLRFNAALVATDAVRYIDRYLVQGLGARQVVIGEDFRFGKGRGGDAALLRREGAARGFGLDVVPPFQVDGEPASSTRIRAALAAGRMADARALLGRDYRISGRVMRGERVGTQLGFPTANIRLHRLVSPLDGIFAVRVSGAGLSLRPAVASVGTRPTVGGGERLLEVHVFDFDGDLYGRRLAVDFVARLRDEVHFPDLESMRQQMLQDARQAGALLGH